MDGLAAFVGDNNQRCMLRLGPTGGTSALMSSSKRWIWAVAATHNRFSLPLALSMLSLSPASAGTSSFTAANGVDAAVLARDRRDGEEAEEEDDVPAVVN